MVTLFLYETNEYWTTKLVKDLRLDQKDHTGDKRLRLNFNITMLDLRCEWAVVDVVSVLGTDQNVTAHVTKWDLDADGVRSNFQGRNRNQKDIDLFDETVTETIDELHENGEDALSLDKESLHFAKENFDFLFVDFFASWCSHCRDLAPTWEKLAEIMNDHHYDNLDDDYTTKPEKAKTAKDHIEDSQNNRDDDGNFQQVVVAKVDCVEHNDVCNEHNIQAYPTLRLFVDGTPWMDMFAENKNEGTRKLSGSSDYNGHRTVLEMIEWLHFVEEQVREDDGARTLHLAHQAARNRLDGDKKAEEDKKWNDPGIQKKKRHHHRVRKNWKDAEHPGCQIAGHLLVDRAPGNFHIMARSKHHDLVPEMTNSSHMVNSLYVGDPTALHWIQERRSKIPTEIEPAITPLDGNVYTTDELHESYHHYMKLVATKIDGMKVGSRELVFYQMLVNSQLAYYEKDVAPEAKFAYDLSPIAVKYSYRSRRWSEYLTSIFAIIGGVFTVVGMLEGVMHRFVPRFSRSQGLG
ncbi:unnamed protein product [Pseudo-nitzschia multistriata]|uniref:Thioredoxin domain-containing protein n=1 Tax=Pseudo-nitzschia multistriata TaxID=183589 RepID=A0A448YY44_9STRA|nr:unnamed protein product [Pseudo-nitzschia multistriata]